MTRPETLPHRDERAGIEEGRVETGTVPGPSSGWTSAFDQLLLIGGLIILHIAVSGTIPSGGDGGNWLALAREWLGESVMSADVVYEPVFTGTLGSLLRVLGPVDALLVSALISEAVLMIAIYLVVKRAGRLPALLSAVLVGVAGYRLEAYAWGAYPQILALGLGLLTVWGVVRLVEVGGWRRLALVVGGVVAVLSTHKLVGGLMLMAVPGAALHAMWLGRFRQTMWKWAGLSVGVVSVVGAFYVGSWLGVSAEGVEPTLNALGLSRAEQLSFAFQEANVIWSALIVLAVIGWAIRSWPTGTAPIVSASFGWVLASVVGFLFLAEPRVLIQAQVAVVPVAVLVVVRWWGAQTAGSRLRRVGALGFRFLAITVFGSILLTGLHRYDLAADWYRVAGQRELNALSALRDVSEPGDLAVASRGPNGNPIGWWLEGYAGIPTYTSIDTAFLAFPEERAQADAAASIFSAPPEEAAEMLDDLDARFLIFDRRGPDAGWLAGGEPLGLTQLSDGTLLILEVPDGS